MAFIGKLNIQLHSGKGLKDVKNFGIMSPYAEIYIATADGTAETKHITNIAKKGDTDPVWDCSIVFTNVPMSDDYNLVITIKHSGTFFDRKVGKVKVPFKDLLAGDASGDKISYRVMTKADKTQGGIVLSHSFTDVVARSDEETGASSSNNSNTNSNWGDDDLSGKKKDGKVKKMGKKVVTGICEIGAAIVAGVVGIEIQDEVDHLIR